MEMMNKKQEQAYLNESGYNQLRSKKMNSMSLKDFLSTIDSIIYDDPADADKKTTSYFDMAKKSFKAIGREQEELEAEAKQQREEESKPRR